jgi:hypothetical protein
MDVSPLLYQKLHDWDVPTLCRIPQSLLSTLLACKPLLQQELHHLEVAMKCCTAQGRVLLPEGSPIAQLWRHLGEHKVH